MKSIKYLTLIITFILVSCQNNTLNKELELKERELDLREKELAIEKERIDSMKNIQQKEVVIPETIARNTNDLYGYIIFQVSKPIYEESKPSNDVTYVDPFDINAPTPPKALDLSSVFYYTVYYTSKVQELKTGDENEKYRLMDEAESELQSTLDKYNENFQLTLNFNAPENVKTAFRNAKATIKGRKFRTFKSYEEASRHLYENKTNFK